MVQALLFDEARARWLGGHVLATSSRRSGAQQMDLFLTKGPLSGVAREMPVTLAEVHMIQTAYRKASSRGAYGHDPFWSVFEEHRLDSTTTDITMALFIL